MADARTESQVLRYTLGLPIAATEWIERGFRWSCGEDWYRAGFNVATVFCGVGALRLIRSTRPSWASWAAAWLLSVVGIAWFALGGWSAIMLIPFLRQGRRVHTAPQIDPEPDWHTKPLWFRFERLDYVSLAIIGVVAAVLAVRFRGFSFSTPDLYYHIQTAQGVLRHGGIPDYDDWSLAPLGRPHLYPPLISLLLAFVSRFFDGDLFDSMRCLRVIWPCAMHFTAWYLARWLFDARWGFLALLISGFAFDITSVSYGALPAVMSANFCLFMLLFFLRRNPVRAIVCGAIGWYFHVSIVPFTLLGLGIFSLLERRFFKQYLLVTGMVIACFSPWLARMYVHSEWMREMEIIPVPGQFSGPIIGRFGRLFWLLYLNVLLVVLAVRGIPMLRWSELRTRIAATQLAAFVPMLISYGGRYFMHTEQLWALFIAAPLARHLDPPVSWRRIGLFMLLALSPTLLFTGPPIVPAANHDWLNPLGFVPMVPGWVMPILVAANTRELLAPPQDFSLAEEVGAFVHARTAPDQIVHAPWDSFDDIQFGLEVATFAERPYGFGAWLEVRGGEEYMELLKKFDTRDPRGVYVTLGNPERVERFAELEWTQIEGAWVGLPAVD